MKKYLFIIAFFITSIINAQTFQIGLKAYTPILFGDIIETDIENPSAGFVNYASGGSLDFKIYTKTDWGFGFKVNYSEYIRNIDAYKEGISKSLGISDSNMIMQSLYTYRYIGFQIGVSHNFKIKGKFNIEPYIFLGAGVFTSPIEEITYFKNNKTYTRKKTITGFATIEYTPGINFQWNFIDEHLGLSLHIEYDGKILEEWSEETVTYSSDSFNKTYDTKDYSISAVNIGIGISYRFGKELNN